MKIALAQINVTVGALPANAEKILRLAQELRRQGASIAAFPELALCGYPPEDLILKRHFLDDARARIEELARALPADLVVVAGAPWSDGGRVYNAAIVFHDGRVAAVARKRLLPNYGVFDEKRVFAEGDRPLVIEVAGRRIGVHICEDSWVPHELPCVALADAGLSLLLNISASPYHCDKARLRERILAAAAGAIHAPVFYCNLVGGQDELVFDGASMAVGPDGRVIARARSFEDDVLWLDVPERVPAAGAGDGFDRVRIEGPAFETAPESVPPRLEPGLEGPAGIYAALRRGLRDYMDKNGFKGSIVALSGGIDSALVAAVAVDALGAERVVGITLPSRYSSEETRSDARALADNLGIRFLEAPIEDIFKTFLRNLEPLWPGREADLTEENLQARIRGVMVMALSNKFGWLVLSTGNKSELATGYCTLYGDMCGGFSLIKDVPKTLVFRLARWRNSQGETPVIPPSTIERPPSAELRPNQRDSDSLPPYEVLDPILERYVERDWSFDRIVADGFDAATVRRVIRLVDASEYKRRQGAPGVKITPKAFGRDRRMPITNLYRERA